MPGQDWSHLGVMIRRHRRQARMSQTDLATAVGMSLRTIGSYERGRVPAGAPSVPDGYYDVARILGWTPDSVDRVLAGGEPQLAGAHAPSEAELGAVVSPAMHLADVARDLGAPSDLVDRYRLAAISLAGWLAHNVASPVARREVDEGFGLAAYRPHAVGEGVAPDDAERILDHFEGK